MTFKELMSLPPEKAEEAYRRGYRDGYVAALQAVYSNREIPEKHWNHWEKTLFDWEQTVTGRMVLPPIAQN